METFTGVDGVLNGGGSNDPDHGLPGDLRFKPYVSGTASGPEIRARLHLFAVDYVGEWRWTFGEGQNCHTFQLQFMHELGLSQGPPSGRGEGTTAPIQLQIGF
jgi:hypothetical protein